MREKLSFKPARSSAPSRIELGDLEDNIVSHAKQNGLLVSIDKHLITPDPNQPRKHFDSESLLELQSSIEAHGLLQPIILRELGQNQYIIIAGERRWQACLGSAKINTIPAVIRNDLIDNLSVLLAQIAENVHRSNMTIVETAAAYKRVYDATNQNLPETAQLLGLSKPRLSVILSVDQASTSVKDLVHTGITNDANVVSSIANLQILNPSKAEELISQAQSGQLQGGGLRKAVSDSLKAEKTKPHKVSSGGKAEQDDQHHWIMTMSVKDRQELETLILARSYTELADKVAKLLLTAISM